MLEVFRINIVNGEEMFVWNILKQKMINFNNEASNTPTQNGRTIKYRFVIPFR